MSGWPTWLKYFAGIFAGALILLFLAFIRCDGIFLISTCGQQLGKFLYDWQTLVTGGVAIVAAIIAVRPVWKQLQHMSVQSGIMAREVLSQRLLITEKRGTDTAGALSSVTDELLNHMYPGQEVTEPIIDSEWAFGADQLTWKVIGHMEADQSSRWDVESIERARARVLVALREQQNCLDDIHCPDSRDLDDPEYRLSDKKKRKVSALAVQAKKNLTKKVFILKSAAEDLNNAFSAEHDKLRDQIRKIDDLINNEFARIQEPQGSRHHRLG
jgi:hypothetical protein